MKHRLLLFLTFSLALLLSIPFLAEASLEVTPRKMTISLAPGDSYSGSFNVENIGDSRKTVTIHLADWDMDEQGNVVFHELGSLPRSLGAWIEYSPAQFTLDPGEVTSVRFVVSIPEEEKESNWGMFLVREISNQQEGKTGLNISISLQYAVTIYQEKEGTRGDGNITRLSVTGINSDSLRFDISFRNRSEAFLRPTGRIEIRNNTGDIVDTLEVPAFLTLPHRSRKVSLPYQGKLGPGEYMALAILDYGVDHLVAGQRRFNIPP